MMKYLSMNPEKIKLKNELRRFPERTAVDLLTNPYTSMFDQIVDFVMTSEEAEWIEVVVLRVKNHKITIRQTRRM